MLLNFNALEMEPATGGSTLFPLDDYLCEIVKVIPVPVKDDKEKGRLVFTLKVLEGAFKGLTQEYGLNIINPSEQAVRIAYQQLTSICLVTGKGGVGDSAELVGGRLLATIGPQDNNDKYSEVKKVMDVQGGAPVKSKPYVATAAGVPVTTAIPAPVPTVVAPAAAAPSATPAWAAPAAADDKPSWMK